MKIYRSMSGRQSRMPRVYLAGPDVFRPNAAEHFALLTAICETLGIQALVPLDESGEGGSAAADIYAANMSLLRSADGVIANLMPFRGAEPDSGTVFEVGVAIALGLPVVAYGVPNVGYAERVPGRRDAAGVPWDVDGWMVEDFGLHMNLMLSCSVQVVDTAEDALKVMGELLADRGGCAPSA